MTADASESQVVAGAPDGSGVGADANRATGGVMVVFAGLMLVLLMAALDQTIVSTALPTIVGDLGGLNHISWVVTAYLLAQTAVTPIYGKLGDLYGRKVVLQFALVVFLAGSALCGIAQSMTMLILFRALQGLGGGGLMVSTMAAIGDVVPPRERGRYQGYFGAVFGLASVVGPLLGGFFTTSLTWRWIFFVNLPIGVIAFAVLQATLHTVRQEAHHRVDYVGAALLAASLSALVLTLTLGGSTYAWDSGFIVALEIATIVLLAAFVWVEQRAAEPVLPPRLFKNRVFTVTSGIGLIVGFGLFGSVTYLPLFLQVVNHASPTSSGLQILPLMGGLLLTSIVSGQLISRTGRYKPFPIIGTALMVIGLILLSTMDAGTSRVQASAFMFVLGLGIGSVMQVLVLAVQNAVDYSDLGVATSGATLFRSVGGSVGTAVLGSIFTNRLATELRSALPPSTGSGVSASIAHANPASLGQAAAGRARGLHRRLHQGAVDRVRRGRRGRGVRVPAQLGAGAATVARHDRRRQRSGGGLRDAQGGQLAGRGVARVDSRARPRGPPTGGRAARPARRRRPVGGSLLAPGQVARGPARRRRGVVQGLRHPGGRRLGRTLGAARSWVRGRASGPGRPAGHPRGDRAGPERSGTAGGHPQGGSGRAVRALVPG